MLCDLRRFKATLGDLRRKRRHLGELHVSEYVAVNFLFQLIFGFPLFLNSLAYITILRNNVKIKMN